VVRTKRLVLGRIMSEPKAGTYGVSMAKNISRNHAELFYQPHPTDPERVAGAWMFKCLGKNGMQWNEEHQAVDAVFQVKDRDKLQIGDTPFYFVEPMHIA
jgi:hypothetical protein